MSNLDWLTEIEARAKAATAGPWDNDRSPLDHEGCSVWPWYEEADMVFAYAAREDIPRLCRTLRAVEKTLVEWEWYRDHTAQAARGPFHDGTCAARETCAAELRQVLRGEEP